jgi:hypothetical protein
MRIYEGKPVVPLTLTDQPPDGWYVGVCSTDGCATWAYTGGNTPTATVSVTNKQLEVLQPFKNR